jgi:hypothetical protein
MASTIRDELNQGPANRIGAIFRDLGLGEILSLIIGALTATETGVTVTANVATLANQPSTLIQANATTATATGEKLLLKGPITGPNAVVPAAGQAVWDGGKKVLFAAADVVTVAKFTYPTAATVTPSLLQRSVGEQP